MKPFWVECTECHDRWVMYCFIEFGYIVPESESCQDCGGDIEVGDEYYGEMSDD